MGRWWSWVPRGSMFLATEIIPKGYWSWIESWLTYRLHGLGYGLLVLLTHANQTKTSLGQQV